MRFGSLAGGLEIVLRLFSGSAEVRAAMAGLLVNCLTSGGGTPLLLQVTVEPASAGGGLIPFEVFPQL
jgi:hypothetical protein